MLLRESPPGRGEKIENPRRTMKRGVLHGEREGRRNQTWSLKKKKEKERGAGGGGKGRVGGLGRGENGSSG